TDAPPIFRLAKPTRLLLIVPVPFTCKLLVVVRAPLIIAAPAISNFAFGEVVPTPRFPDTANPLDGPIILLAKPITPYPTVLRFPAKVVLPLIVPVPTTVRLPVDVSPPFT